ncbi:UNVERIFIED_CONTAM: hypothetical protein NCL1_30774 [Trichonephila clavipes]
MQRNSEECASWEEIYRYTTLPPVRWIGERFFFVHGATTVQKVAFSYFSQRFTNVGTDSNRAPYVPNASTLSITPKRSSSRDV